MLDAEPAALESNWQPRPVEDGECALFRIVRGLGDPWDATGQRHAVVFHSDESCGAEGLFSDPRVRLESRKHWEEIYAARDARRFAEIDAFIFMIEVTVDPEVRAEFDVWYTNKHVPDVRSAGMTRARRFHRIGSAATFLATYEMVSPAVLSSDALARVRGFEQFTPHIVSIDRAVLHPLSDREAGAV